MRNRWLLLLTIPVIAALFWWYNRRPDPMQWYRPEHVSDLRVTVDGAEFPDSFEPPRSIRVLARFRKPERAASTKYLPIVLLRNEHRAHRFKESPPIPSIRIAEKGQPEAVINDFVNGAPVVISPPPIEANDPDIHLFAYINWLHSFRGVELDQPMIFDLWIAEQPIQSDGTLGTATPSVLIYSKKFLMGSESP